MSLPTPEKTSDVDHSFFFRLIRLLTQPKELRNSIIANELHSRAERIRRVMRSLPTRWLYLLGHASIGDSFVAYHPDSFAIFKRHPEFGRLFNKFSKHNRLNNAGDSARLWTFIMNIKQIIAEGIQGDFAEVGVWRGNSAAVLAHYAKESGRRVWLFDTFDGFAEKDLVGIDTNKQLAFADTSIELVKNVIDQCGDTCMFVKGYFPGSATEEHRCNLYALVSLDCDLYEPMKAGLEFFYPRMPRGGLFLLHDYSSLHWDGAKTAIDEFCRSSGEFVVLIPDKSGTAVIRKNC